MPDTYASERSLLDNLRGLAWLRMTYNGAYVFRARRGCSRQLVERRQELIDLLRDTALLFGERLQPTIAQHDRGDAPAQLFRDLMLLQHDCLAPHWYGCPVDATLVRGASLTDGAAFSRSASIRGDQLESLYGPL